jgi:hypothetical protein
MTFREVYKCMKEGWKEERKKERKTEREEMGEIHDKESSQKAYMRSI